MRTARRFPAKAVMPRDVEAKDHPRGFATQPKPTVDDPAVFPLDLSVTDKDVR